MARFRYFRCGRGQRGRGPRQCAHNHLAGLHQRAREEDLLQSGDDDLVVRREPRLHDAQPIGEAAERDVLAQGLVLRTDYIDVLAILVGHDRLVVDQHCPELGAAPKLHARVQTRGERAVGIRHHRTQVDRAGGRVDLVVDEVDRAGIRKAHVVGKPYAHRIARVRPLAFARQCHVAQIGLLVRLEVDIDRVLRDHAGQHALVGLGQIADRQHGAADAPGDGRAHLGEAEIELGHGQRRLGRPHVRVALGQAGLARVEFLARDRVGRDQCPCALIICVCQLRRRAQHVRAAPLRCRRRTGRDAGRSRTADHRT